MDFRLRRLFIYSDNLDGFCTYKAFKEACQGRHDFVNSPVASPDVPQ